MEKENACISSRRTSFLPPGRGLALGWRLALSTVLIVGLVMGGISFGQQFLELREDRHLHQKLLAMSLAPLAVRLEAATKLDNLEREVEDFHAAYVKNGYRIHEVVLLDAANKPLLSAGASEDGGHEVGHIQTVIPIFSPLLDGGNGRLIVTINSDEYRDAVRRDWRRWAIHFVATLGVVFLFLASAIYFQVTKPINRLVRIVKKMERGYWTPIVLASGAWEIRWLAWRFGSMVKEVQAAMTLLLEAEQKARSLMPQRADSPVVSAQERQPGSGMTVSDHDGGPAYRELVAVCERLETTSPDDPQAAELGRSAWRQQAVEADRLGLYEIKARLEDAALRLMEPDTYESLDDRLASLKEFRQDWMEQCRDALYHLLEETSIPCVGILHRVKHTAGVWTKMQSKELNMDEIQDLFAFRIIVPTEADCYAALGVIHQHYKPVIARFKDYIAKPKENGYRSLHTCIADDHGPVFELQIRSVAMDRQAERGNAAHWVYKKAGRETTPKRVVTRWWRKLSQ
jgi:ppGpp synthetase/RelA/SpoT-type nucleotidyltranferase/HAMP domain-containing protein